MGTTTHSRVVAVTLDRDIRCWRCQRLLIALAARPWAIQCHRCHARNQSAPLPYDPTGAAPASAPPSPAAPASPPASPE